MLDKDTKLFLNTLIVTIEKISKHSAVIIFLFILNNYPSTKIVGMPKATMPPCWQLSPILAIGLFIAVTVALPKTTLSGGPTQTAISPINAAGITPTSTVAPVPITGPPTCGIGPVNLGQTCNEVIMAAGLGI
jgi:hypothetical protein